MNPTRGPWKVKSRGDADIVIDADGKKVADCYSASRKVEEIFANAKFISHAPEMREMLDDCYDLLNATMPDLTMTDDILKLLEKIDDC